MDKCPRCGAVTFGDEDESGWEVVCDDIDICGWKSRVDKATGKLALRRYLAYLDKSPCVKEFTEKMGGKTIVTSFKTQRNLRQNVSTSKIYQNGVLIWTMCGKDSHTKAKIEAFCPDVRPYPYDGRSF